MKAFLNSPYVKLFCGLLLLLTSGSEVITSLGDGSIGTHHGVFVFGLVQILKAIPELQEGVRDLVDAEAEIDS